MAFEKLPSYKQLEKQLGYSVIVERDEAGAWKYVGNNLETTYIDAEFLDVSAYKKKMIYFNNKSTDTPTKIRLLFTFEDVNTGGDIDYDDASSKELLIVEPEEEVLITADEVSGRFIFLNLPIKKVMLQVDDPDRIQVIIMGAN